MGRKEREHPRELAKKLLQVRLYLGMSQTEIWRALGLERTSSYHVISKFESGMRDPSIPVLLRYARLAGITMEILADDELSLPKKFNKKPTE